MNFTYNFVLFPGFVFHVFLSSECFKKLAFSAKIGIRSLF